MDGFEVPLEELTAAAAAASRLGGAVRTVDLATPVGALGAALPGGATAQAAPSAAGGWAAVVTAVAGGLEAQGGKLSAAVARYAEADETAWALLRGAI